MRALLGLFFDPPMAVARVGGSATPMVAFEWQESRVSQGGTQTTVVPALSFEVRPDGRLAPFMPAELRFKDDDGAIRPVAPFLGLWARLQRADGGVDEEPVTLALLDELGVSLQHVAVSVDAANAKAARRTNDDACAFGARVEIAGTDHAPRPLLAFSPHTARQQPLVSPERPIPIGQVQWIRPVAERDPAYPDVDLSALRLRFTPARGRVYGLRRAAYGPDRLTVTGPMDVLEFATRVDGRVHMIVEPENRILCDGTAFDDYRICNGLFYDPQPQDGYDGSDDGAYTAWGVVDDTCDALITASIAWRGQRHAARARVFVGPPQYAPDRRPFFSIEADLADRDLPPVSITADNVDSVKGEVVQLFRRIFETAAALNLDQARTEGLQDNIGKSAAPGAGLPRTDAASMTRADVPYIDRVPDLMPGQPTSLFSPSVAGDRLPYTQVVPFVHAQLMEEAVLLDFLRRRHAHVKRLLRPAFGLITEWADEPGPDPNPAFRDPRVVRDMMHDMRMPPYMRDAYYAPLSLTRRQYLMLTQFLDLLAADDAPAPAATGDAR